MTSPDSVCTSEVLHDTNSCHAFDVTEMIRLTIREQGKLTAFTVLFLNLWGQNAALICFCAVV